MFENALDNAQVDMNSQASKTGSIAILEVRQLEKCPRLNYGRLNTLMERTPIDVKKSFKNSFKKVPVNSVHAKEDVQAHATEKMQMHANEKMQVISASNYAASKGSSAFPDVHAVLARPSKRSNRYSRTFDKSTRHQVHPLARPR